MPGVGASYSGIKCDEVNTGKKKLPGTEKYMARAKKLCKGGKLVPHSSDWWDGADNEGGVRTKYRGYNFFCYRKKK